MSRLSNFLKEDNEEFIKIQKQREKLKNEDKNIRNSLSEQKNKYGRAKSKLSKLALGMVVKNINNPKPSDFNYK